MNIITLAFDMANAVQVFTQKAKKFFYSVMLLGCRCPKCNGSLVMVGGRMVRCISCGLEFDPTIKFERCLNCGGVAVLHVRRYQCKDCSGEIKSKFLFDGLVFDKEYFRKKVADSRQRKKEQRERVRQMLAESRSANLLLETTELEGVPGLVEALNSLTSEIDENIEVELRDKFDLGRYEAHIQAYIQNSPLSLSEIPPLNQENTRKDLIWRFVAVIFLAHTCVVDIWQEGQNIMVMKHEANREGQGVFGELEESDGIQRSMGGVKAW